MKLLHSKPIVGGGNWLYSNLGFNISKEFTFKDFREAWSFIRLLTLHRDLSAKNNLNYEFTNLYNKVSFRVPLKNLETVEVIENVYRYSQEGHVKLNKF